MAIDIFRNLRNTPLWPLVKISDDYYMVNAELRKYHSAAHAFNVVQGVNELTDHNPSVALIIAALWHDAVYFPNAGSDANERCSSAALGIEARKIARSVELSKDLKDAVNDAQEMIENTAVKYHLHDRQIGGELAILLDADLASLAASAGQFYNNQLNIIIENGGEVNAVNCKKSAEFLRQFLRCRPYIYHTDKGRELWETKARDNIVGWCTPNNVEI